MLLDLLLKQGELHSTGQIVQFLYTTALGFSRVIKLKTGTEFSSVHVMFSVWHSHVNLYLKLFWEN